MLSPRSERRFANQVRDPHLSSACLKPNRRVAYQDEGFRPQQAWYTPNLAACTSETSGSPQVYPAVTGLSQAAGLVPSPDTTHQSMTSLKGARIRPCPGSVT
jgi:hypothetical protein